MPEAPVDVPTEQVQRYRHPKDLLKQGKHTKICRNNATVTVNGYVYTFFPRLEGKWSGERQEIRPTRHSTHSSNICHSQVRSVSTKIAYHEDGYWTLRESTALEDGAATVHYMKLTPVAHGILSVRLTTENVCSDSRPPVALTLTETPHGCHLVQQHPAAESPDLFELITLSPQGSLHRSSHIYENGEVTSMCVANEKRVE